MENLAIRMIYESSILSNSTKRNLYCKLFYGDKKNKKAQYGSNGGRKTHQWFLKAVFGSKTVEQPAIINTHGAIFYPPDTSDPFQGFNGNGHVDDRSLGSFTR